MFLERYDSIEFRGWGSANDMIPWELGGDWQVDKDSPQGRNGG
jgi:hypothetical protein